MVRILVALAALAIFTSTPAAAEEEFVLSKEGHWSVGRGTPDSRACFARVSTKAGQVFGLRAAEGDFFFAVLGVKPLRRGKKGVLATDVYSFDFEPSFTEGGGVYFDGALSDRVIAALRLAAGSRCWSTAR